MPLAGIREQRQAAHRLFQEALARAEADRQRTEQGAVLQRGQLERGFETAQDQVLQEAGGRGLGRSPRTAGRPIRGLQEQLGIDLAGVDFQRDEMLGALLAMEQRAEADRESTLAQLAAEERRIKAQQRAARLQRQAMKQAQERQLAALRQVGTASPSQPSAAPAPAPSRSSGGSSGSTSAPSTSTPTRQTTTTTAPRTDTRNQLPRRTATPKITRARQTSMPGSRFI